MNHVKKAVSLKGMSGEIKKVEGFNAKLAVFLTNGVGTMACAYLFAILALSGLPAALKTGGQGFVPWFAQTFLQLVLLSIIMVGQSVQSAAADVRAIKTLDDAEKLMDLLNVETEGGIKSVLDAVNSLKPRTTVKKTVSKLPEKKETK